MTCFVPLLCDRAIFLHLQCLASLLTAWRCRHHDMFCDRPVWQSHYSAPPASCTRLKTSHLPYPFCIQTFLQLTAKHVVIKILVTQFLRPAFSFSNCLRIMTVIKPFILSSLCTAFFLSFSFLTVCVVDSQQAICPVLSVYSFLSFFFFFNCLCSW